MQISKQSWHARFYDGDLNKKTNLCSYFSVVIGNLLEYLFGLIQKACFYIVIVGVLVFSAILIYRHSLEFAGLLGMLALVSFLFSVVAVTLFVSGVFIGAIFDEEDPRPNTPAMKIRSIFRPLFLKLRDNTTSFTSVARAYLKAKKDKVCPTIDFVE
jgi:hypothetical protein